MWQKLTIESKNSIEEYTKNRFEICDLNFSNLLLWSIGENTEYKIENDKNSNGIPEYWSYVRMLKNCVNSNLHCYLIIEILIT